MDKEKMADLTVGGYVFATHDDAELARNEIKKIAYIESKMDMNNMRVVQGIYNKALESGTFQTPIGMEFMHSMYASLINSGIDKDSVAPIPLYTTFRRLDSLDGERHKIKATKKQQKELSIKERYRNSVIVNAILAALIVIMFLITFNGESANAINYKSAVINRYSEWEQELSERESAVREKERELNLNSLDD